MNDNELLMKLKGEQKVLKEITTKLGNIKEVSATQVGQQILFTEALKILPKIIDWIHNGSAKVYRGELKSYFVDEQFTLEKITQTLLFLSGTIYFGDSTTNSKQSKTRHKKINSLRSKIMPELGFEQCFRFLEVIVDYSQYFSVEKENEFKLNKPNLKLTYKCNISLSILEDLADKSFKAFYPMPTTTLPKPWFIDKEGEAIGGYEDYQLKLVRADAKHIDYSKFSNKILDSINYIQSTPWIINIPLLETVKTDLVEPKREDYIKVDYPNNEDCMWEVDLKDKSCNLSKQEVKVLEVERLNYRNKVSLHKAEAGDYESAVGKYRAVKLALSIAEQYKYAQEIYFPHSYDFRGRVYPLPIGLTPQGSDAVKSLLLYKDVEPLTERGVLWNWAYLASLFGDDKLEFLDRVERGKDLLEVDYKEADEPYQFLSHQMEMQKYTVESTYIPNTRIHLDACNSGSQFTSAITGDLDGCIATNVIPTIVDGKCVRKDAYLLVAQRALALTNEMLLAEDDHKAKQTLIFFRDLLEESGRKVCKVPVMVSNYGGTAGGRTEILWNLFRELDVERKWITRKTAALLSKIIGDSIIGVLKGGKAFEIYIHKMNNIIAKNNKPIIWSTSDGFQVVHIKNKELKAKQVTCMLPGARRSTTITKRRFSDAVSAPKMKSAISPNYIHSLDAELLRRVAMKMNRAGIVYTDWIHDSFGCHPNNVDFMLEITKDEFRKLIKRAPLRVLDAQLREQMQDDKSTTKALRDTKMPHLRGFNTSDGDLSVVMKSSWFFS
jgi:DNA-directed RNA polymerase